jgi:hypothetical protein
MTAWKHQHPTQKVNKRFLKSNTFAQQDTAVGSSILQTIILGMEILWHTHVVYVTIV